MMGEICAICLKIKLVVYLLFALSQPGFGLSAGHREATLYGAIEVVDYRGFSNLQILRFLIPQQANQALWRFRAFASDADCVEKVISINLQMGSYPLASPYNESFPDRFHVGRTGEHQVSVTSGNASVIHVIHHPQPGEWYAAAYTTQVHDKIVQKGLGPKCRYFLEPAMSIDVHRQVETLDKKRGSVHVKAHGNKLVRFFLNEPAWEFRVHIIGCGVMPGTLLSNFLCNLTVMARSSALPSAKHGEGEITCAPTPNDECILKVASPDVQAWQYLSFTNHGEKNISVQFVLESTVCSGEIYLVATEQDNSTEDCSVLPELDRYRGYGDFRSVMGVLAFSTVITPQVILYDRLTTVIPFTLEPQLDIGGTLKTKLTLVVLVVVLCQLCQGLLLK